ncbi:NosD domain-containing protein [Methanosarcina hadiensis]|uniref:NosD domain-containing protein n=1 Tax=Methanosarcina hadiensis TaxID=3078083 RepID=UPI003977A149
MLRLATLLVGIMMFTAVSGTGNAAEIIVESGGSIQNAVSSANSGDVIIVKPGTYTENIRITATQDLVIRSESGKPEDTIITAKSSTTSVFYTEVNNITISGFKITGAGSSSAAGVYLVRCSNCTVTGNDLSDNYIGIYLRYSDYNKVLNNAVLGGYRGIYLQDSNYNNISENGASSSTQYGIHLTRSQRNTLSNNIANSNNYGIVLENASHNSLNGNTVNSNNAYGLYLTSSSDCGLIGNTASGNDRGIYLIRSNSTTISGNKVSGNDVFGILASYSNYNTISGNTANTTFRGIHLDSSDGNTVSDNIVAFNSVSGLFMCAGSDGNRVFNNYLNNTLNADINNTRNTWNATKTAGVNIVGGPYTGGNFWANPSGTGFSQAAMDANGDGIADGQYNGGKYTDYLPLVLKSGKQQPVLPVANFNSNVTGGNAPLAVQFMDASQYATGWKWDFETDGIIDSSAQNPVHVYTVAGTYTVTLTAVNANGTASKTATITVSEPTKPIMPVANFNSNVTSGNAPLSVQFTDASQHATEWKWDFENDGTVDSTIQNPVKVYATSGTYTVNLTAVNANGTSSKLMTIAVYNPLEPVTPVADFTTNVTSGNAPLAVQFTDLSLNAVSWSWDFENDGISDSNIQNPAYVYEIPGIYAVSLSAGNQNGTASKTATITVLETENIKDVLPVADFSMNVSEGYAPLSVLYTDLSQNATEIGWDFNNDGKAEVNSSTVVYVYTSPGTYTVNLFATNANGTTSKTATVTVLKENSSGGSSKGGSSGGSNGGSGGSGGSPEPSKNVQVKELCQVFVTNGDAVKFDLKRNATCISYVSFDAKKTAGKTTTIVEQLKNKSALVPALPDGEVYKSFNVWVGNSGFASTENIENPVICFKVEKAWMKDKNIDQTSISLNRYSSKTWERLPVNLSGEDSRHLYFTAEVPGFSFFAITGKTNALPEESMAEMESGDKISAIKENDMENTKSEVEKESGQVESMKSPGLEAVSGMACLIAVFLYIRKISS